jgi:hypothetical protein
MPIAYSPNTTNNAPHWGGIQGETYIMNTLTVDLVITNGLVDQAASKAAFDTALAAYVVEHEVENSVIKDAVLSVLAEANGQNVKMSRLTSIAAVKMHAQNENFSSIERRIAAYVKANSVGDNSLFVSRKGPGGGVAVRTAAVAEPVATTTTTTTVAAAEDTTAA